MNYTDIKPALNSAIDSVCLSISNYAVHPGRDFTRSRKLPPDVLMKFMIAEGSSSTKNEIIDFFGVSHQPPTSSALAQQRDKLLSEALHKVFDNFNEMICSCNTDTGYRYIAADGSTVSYFSRDKYSPLYLSIP